MQNPVSSGAKFNGDLTGVTTAVLQNGSHGGLYGG